MIQSTRLAYFDQMKGLAILMVVCGHVTQFCFGWQGCAANRFLEIFQLPLFFYVSGYFAYKALPNFREAWSKITKRTHALLIPFFVACALWCISHSDDTFLGMLSRGGGKYWFLWVLGLLTIFFTLWEFLVGRIKNPVLYVASWIVPFLLLFGASLYKNEVTNWLAVGLITNYYRYFLIGWLCKKYIKLNNLIFKNQIALTLGLIAFALQYYFAETPNMILTFLGGVGAIIAIQHFFVSFESKNNSRILHALNYLGQHSLAIYILHFYFIPDFKSLNIGQNISPQFLWQMGLALAVATVIVACVLIVERVISQSSYLAWLLFGKRITK